MSDRIYNVLFSAQATVPRFVLAEPILREHRQERFRALSAEGQPKDTINPFAIKVLESLDEGAAGGVI